MGKFKKRTPSLLFSVKIYFFWVVSHAVGYYYFFKSVLRKSVFKNLKLDGNKLSLSPVLSFIQTNKGIIYSLLITFLISGFSYWTYNFVFKELPSPLDLTKKRQIVTTRILDRNGKLLYRIYQDENRTVISLDQIPQHMINATLAIEDKNFYKHRGFSIKGISRALLNNLSEDSLQGGSTITQQLVKNRLLNSDKTIKRKLRELVLSILVEGTFTKDEILQMYLNEVAYGGSTYGIEEAAYRYFEKSAKDLTLAESALLAGLPAAPSIYTPFGSNPELSQRRQQEVLRRMVEDNFISIEEAYQAQESELVFRKDVIDIEAPHFVMYVKKLLAQQYGEQALTQDGLIVRTSLDLNLQYKVQEIVADKVNQLSRLNVNNGAALVTNPQSGEILAMVGSKNYFDFDNDGQVNVALRPRQPGSSIKPLTYALAFENGKKPWTVIDDSPVVYQQAGAKPYQPRNYDGRFRGNVTLREALASSYNVPAVKLLASLGVDKLINKAELMGIETWEDRTRFGLALTLGGGEVLMTDMAQLYGAFANGGYTVGLKPFLEIKNFQGEVLYRNPCMTDPQECRQNQTLDPLVAYQINSVLSDDFARVPAFGRYSVLDVPGHEVAVKTGTTNNLRDNWTIGYTTDRLAAVWVGNNDNSSMSNIASGITGASPIWNEVMKLLLDSNRPHAFKPAEDLIKIKICAQTGTLPCSSCPRVVEEVFKKGEQPTKACTWEYFVNKKEPEQKKLGERQQIL